MPIRIFIRSRERASNNLPVAVETALTPRTISGNIHVRPTGDQSLGGFIRSTGDQALLESLVNCCYNTDSKALAKLQRRNVAVHKDTFSIEYEYGDRKDA